MHRSVRGYQSGYVARDDTHSQGSEDSRTVDFMEESKSTGTVPTIHSNFSLPDFSTQGKLVFSKRNLDQNTIMHQLHDYMDPEHLVDEFKLQKSPDEHK